MREQETARTPNSGGSKEEIISVDEAVDRYLGDWVIMPVTRFDDDHIPSDGRIIGHWPPGEESDRIITKTLRELLRSPAKPGNPYYLFSARPTVRPDPEIKEAAKEMAARIAATLGGRGARRGE